MVKGGPRIRGGPIIPAAQYSSRAAVFHVVDRRLLHAHEIQKSSLHHVKGTRPLPGGWKRDAFTETCVLCDRPPFANDFGGGSCPDIVSNRDGITRYVYGESKMLFVNTFPSPLLWISCQLKFVYRIRECWIEICLNTKRKNIEYRI